MEEEQLEAIDTSSGDESAGLDTSRQVPAGEDNSGMGPVADAGAIDTSEAPQDNVGPNGPIARNLRAFPGNVKRIASYLMGEGAADPQVIAQAGQQADPEGQLSPDERNAVAVQKVAETQGPEAAWKLMQSHRVAYNAKQAFGYAALNGTAQKRPDLAAAVDAANQAAQHVLDGSSSQFAVGPDGQVTATVKSPGSNQPQVFNLTPDAFRRYLNVGQDGQYDRLMQPGGVAKTIAGLSRSGGQGQTRISQLRPLPKQAPPASDEPEPLPAEETNFGKTPSTMNLSGSNKVQYGSMDRPATEDASLSERGDRLFPSVSQQTEKEAWMNAEMARREGNENKIDVAAEKGAADRDKARITGQSRENVAATGAGAKVTSAQLAADARREAIAAKQSAESGKLAVRIRELEARNANSAQLRALKVIQTKRLALEPLTPQEEAQEKSFVGDAEPAAAVTRPAAPQQAPQQRAPQAPQKQGNAQQPPVPGAKLYKGTWYTRGPNGESVPYQP